MTRRQLILTAAVAPLAMAATTNIQWGLGAVTWSVKAGPRKLHWSEIVPDVAAAGFNGVEPFTTNNLPVNDENMNELEPLLAKYKLRVSTIYWGDNFHLVSERERLLKDCHKFLGYLKRFGSDRLIYG